MYLTDFTNIRMRPILLKQLKTGKFYNLKKHKTEKILRHKNYFTKFVWKMGM